MRRAVGAAVLTAALAGCGGEPVADRAATTPTASPSAAAPVPTVTLEEIERANAPPTPRPTPAPPRVRRPPIERAPIPFPAKRRTEMAAYAQRHYGFSSYRLTDPRVIVQHYTATEDAAGAIALFEPDRPDPELGELPNVCAHFVIDRDGTIQQLVPLSTMCRHTVGLNHTAIGIEHAGFSAEEVLGNRPQLRASLRLTRWLQCRYGIEPADVIGHNENRSSPHHRERVDALRSQTHPDFTASEMVTYRRRLARSSAGPGC